MAFNKKYYNEVKSFIDYQINNVNFMLVDEYRSRPIEWCKTFLPLIANSIHDEDFESAKAVSDSIRDFLNKFLGEDEKILPTTKFKIPDFQQVEIKGVVCFVDGTAKVL